MTDEARMKSVCHGNPTKMVLWTDNEGTVRTCVGFGPHEPVGSKHGASTRFTLFDANGGIAGVGEELVCRLCSCTYWKPAEEE